MIIDGHSHVILPAEEHIKIMDEAGVHKTILFSTSVHPENAKDLQELKVEMKKLNDVVGGKNSSLIETKRKSINELMTVIKSYPDRYIGFGNVPLGVSENDTNLYIGENIANNNLAGIGEFTPANGQVKLLDIIFKASMNFGRLPIWIHGFNPLSLQDIREIAELCKTYSNIPVILGHLGGSNWMESINLAKEIPNLYLDTSAYFSTLVLKIVVNEIPQKCIFGVDMPYGDLKLSLDAVRKVCKDSYVEDAVLGNNIASLLNL